MITTSVAKPPPEEPDAVVPHVRVCEGASGQQPLALLGEVVNERNEGMEWMKRIHD
jgi:hypothetical protein